MADDLQIIDRIYEAGVVAETWPDVLYRLSQGYQGVGGVLFTFAANGAQNWVASPDIRPHIDEFVLSGLGPTNPRPGRLAALNYSGFASDLDAFTPEEIDRDEFYTDYLAPRGMGWTAATMIAAPSGDVLAFSIDRAFKKGPFEDHELLALDDLRPHLARAALWSVRLDLQKAKAMTAALELVGLPSAVLRSGGKLYAANPSFQRLIPAVVQDRAARLALTNKAADAILSDTVQRLEARSATGQSRSIAIPSSGGNAAVIAHVAPIRGAANDIFSQSVALLMITPVDRVSVPTAEVLQGLFDLTPAEARVARGIAEAKTIDAIALTHGVARETVRSQLAAVLGKTGLNRQAELVALLSGKGFGDAADD